mgnify:CR=1 FL=1
MTTELSKTINIGKDTHAKLKQVGIDTFEKLVSTGTEQAFIKLQTIHPDACINLLYSIDGAINGVKWNNLPSERKKELLDFFKMVKKH